MSTKRFPLVAAIVCGILLFMAGAVSVSAQAETPGAPEAEVNGPAGIAATPSQYLSYQGTLRDNSGNPDNGTHNMSVSIYDNSAGSGTALFTQSFTGVVVRDGHFSLMLSGITPGTFSGADRFLKLTVDGSALTPTQRLAPVPYAVSANYANSLAAPDGDPLAPISVNNDGNITVGDSYALYFGLGARQALNLYSTNYGIGVQSSTQYFRSDSNFAWFIDGTHSNTELDPGTGGTAAMVLHDGKLGIGTTAPAARLHVATESGNNIPQVTTATDNIAGVEYYSNGKRWQLSKRASTEGDELRFYYHDGTSWQTPAVRVKPDGSVNIHNNLTMGSDNHAPIIFQKFTMQDHCYANFYTNYDANDWACVITSWKASGDIAESGKKYPLIGAWTWVDTSDNDWVFAVDIGDSCGEEWEFIGMCVDRRLVYWAPQRDFPPSSAAAAEKSNGAEDFERVDETPAER